MPNKSESEKTKIDSYQPDYEATCDNCGQSPVVTCVKNGAVVYSLGMCGSCTFGEEESIDPENWN